MKVPPVSQNLDRAAAWTWRLLVCAAALAVVLALVWYLRVITLPVAIALTIAPALSPVASWFRGRRHLAKPAAGLALLDRARRRRAARLDRGRLGRRAVRRARRFGRPCRRRPRRPARARALRPRTRGRPSVGARGLVAAGVELRRLGRAGRCRARHRHCARRRDALLRAAGRRRPLGVDPAALPVRRSPGGRPCGAARMGRPRRVRSRDGAGRDHRRTADRDRPDVARRAACARAGRARVHGLVRAVRRRRSPPASSRSSSASRTGAGSSHSRSSAWSSPSSSSRARSSSPRSRAAASTCTRRSCCSP